jgi:hypothetical protein
MTEPPALAGESAGVLLQDIGRNMSQDIRTPPGLSLGVSNARFVITAVVVHGRESRDCSQLQGVSGLGEPSGRRWPHATD